MGFHAVRAEAISVTGLMGEQVLGVPWHVDSCVREVAVSGEVVFGRWCSGGGVREVVFGC
jgi:hypothetical protein